MKKQTKKPAKNPIQIAICEKDAQNAAHIWQMISDCGLKADIFCFSSNTGLMRRFAKGRYDIIFCDTEAVRDIRARDEKVTIAVLTDNIKNSRRELIGLNILKYIEGKAAEDDILDAYALSRIHKCKIWQVVVTHSRKGFIKIPPDIIYRAEKRARGCVIYTTRGIIKTGRACDFNALINTLSGYGFMLCEGDVLVNPRYTRFMDEDEVPPIVGENSAFPPAAESGKRAVTDRPYTARVRLCPAHILPVTVGATVCARSPA